MRAALPALGGLLLCGALAPTATACTVDLGPHVEQDLGPVALAVHHGTCPYGERYVQARVLDTVIRIPLPG